ncbi:MAG: hypothetical protein QW478_00255 [Candidatus Micrarchaeaceae archaeon]
MEKKQELTPQQLAKRFESLTIPSGGTPMSLESTSKQGTPMVISPKLQALVSPRTQVPKPQMAAPEGEFLTPAEEEFTKELEGTRKGHLQHVTAPKVEFTKVTKKQKVERLLPTIEREYKFVVKVSGLYDDLVDLYDRVYNNVMSAKLKFKDPTLLIIAVPADNQNDIGILENILADFISGFIKG